MDCRKRASADNVGAMRSSNVPFGACAAIFSCFAIVSFVGCSESSAPGTDATTGVDRGLGGDADPPIDSGSAGEDAAPDATTDSGAVPEDAAADGGLDAGLDTGADAGPMVSASEMTLRNLIASASPTTAEVEAALDDVARGDGLPLLTAAGTYLFACACGPGSWELAGDHEGWMGEAMNENGDLFWLERTISSPVDSGYKFHDGATAWVADPRARRYNYDFNGELSFVEADQAHLERWPGLASHGLRPRTVRVWVPTGRAFDRVLYAHDGQNLFDPNAAFGGWQLQSALPPGILVVALDNTPDRFDEYTHVPDNIGNTVGGNATNYAAFLTTTVRPMMDARYGAGTRYGLLGSSLGGLISLVIAEADPISWDFAASMSGTVGWGSIGMNNETIIERFASSGLQPVAIYLDSGGNGTCVDSDMDGIMDDDPASFDNFCVNNQLRDTLDANGWIFDTDLWHWWEPDAPHNEAAWAARVWRPLDHFATLP